MKRTILTSLTIFLLSFSLVFAQSYDAISNGEEWFVCNADGSLPSDSNPGTPLSALDQDNIISEYNTFSERNNGVPTCAGALERIFQKPFASCDPADCSGSDYCEGPGGAEVEYTYGNFHNDCLEICYMDGIRLDDTGTYQLEPGTNLPEVICQEYPQFCGIYTSTTSSPVGESIPKNLCGLSVTCLGGTTESCVSDLGGQLCQVDEICDGQFVYSNEALPGDPPEIQQNCCIGATQLCEVFAPADCIVEGGIPRTGPGTCTGREVADCCFQGTWELNPDENVFQQVYPSSKFICHREQNQNKFIECCPDFGQENCKNSLNPLYDDRSNQLFVGKGGSFHTLNNYDEYDANDQYLIDKVKRYPASPTSSEVDLVVRKYDWSGYDTFEFDIAFSNSNIDKIILKDENDQTQELDLKSVLNNGDGTYRWHHAMIPLNDGNMDYSTMDEDFEPIKITFSQPPYPDIVVDNLRLVDDGADHSESYFCSGDWNEWVKNLDGNSTDSGFAPNADILEKSPAKVACNSQAAYGYTGNRCCGDDTTRSNYGEFFSDTENGCFNGTTIWHDWSLANATNLEDNYAKHLLFYEGEFWICGMNAYNQRFMSVKESFDGSTQGSDLLSASNVMDFFSIQGSWYCDTTGWVSLNDAQKIKILASTLKEKGENEGDFILHCGTKEDVLNSFEDDQVLNIPGDTNFCALKTDAGVTLGIQTNDVDEFLEDYIALQYHPFTNYPSSQYVCRGAGNPFTAFTNTDFYQTCIDTHSAINASYNQPLGLLLFSLKETASTSGIIGFFLNIWQALVDFFSNLFSDAATPIATYPIPETAVEGEFEELFISSHSGQIIRGIRGEDNIVVTYTGFTTDMTFLKDLSEEWLIEEGIASPSIALDGTADTEQTISIEQLPANFPWTYLTSNLRFD